MNRRKSFGLALAWAFVALVATPGRGRTETSTEGGSGAGRGVARAAVGHPSSDGPASASPALDLTKASELAVVAGEWRVREAAIVPIGFLAAGADGQPGTMASRTYDVEPRAGWNGFDDSEWPVVEPGSLSQRLGGGRLSFVWYRLRFTVPETIGGEPVAGRSLEFEVSIDDAAEVWVDGELRRCPGQAGGSMVAGWNAPNQVVVTRAAVPGTEHELAVFGVNGPLSGAPTNYVWLRSARLTVGEGDAAPRAVPSCEENLLVERFDADADRVLSQNPKLFLVAEGVRFAEGPVWDPADGGSLLFSDPNANRIYRWSAATGLALERERSGYAGDDVARYRQPGSNGLAIDREGRLVVDQHGNRRVVRLERDGSETVLAERDGGRRLNSPNDVVVSAAGIVYFTDPFFGLPGFAGDPDKELPYQGVYRIVDGRTELLASDLSGPNGLAFSPDERHLYVGDWDDAAKIVRRYPVLADGRLGAGETWIDLTAEPGEEAIDGVKTDEAGRIYVSGPGGLWIFGADGRRIARVTTPRHVHNLAWGEDGTVLFLAARDHVYRMPTRTRGHAPHLAPAPRVVALDPAFEDVVPSHARPELLALGHHWLEGPAWSAATGELYFSDIPRNAIFAVAPQGGERRVRERAGYSGDAPFVGREPGTNGLAFDAAGRLLACQHGDRRVVRFETDGSTTVIADRFEGRRLNSPNDLVVLPDGEVWFTDPPFGLPGGFDDPARELPFQGVYRVTAEGDVRLLTRDVRAPNGLALSPDGRTLYVSNAEPRTHAVVYAFEVRPDRTLGPARRFVDLTPESRAGAAGAPDGLEVDAAGRVWLAGPGGIHVFDEVGRRLGRIELPRATANLELSGDGHLYVAADTAIWRLPVAAAKPRRGDGIEGPDDADAATEGAR